jgi:3-dehydroquinate synthase
LLLRYRETNGITRLSIHIFVTSYTALVSNTYSASDTSFTVELSGTGTSVLPCDDPLKTIERIAGKSRSIFIFDENTAALLDIDEDASLVIPPGESQKNMDTVCFIAGELLRKGVTRDSCLIAVGGGVVCDVAAFCASIYMRGMRLLLLPTTLLSMVDASLGGKTGVDFRGYKNILGSFYPAEAVIISPPLLRSLPDGEFRSGLAEVIKHSLLGEKELYRLLDEQREELLRRNPDILREVVMRSLKVKACYVEKDPKESGIRGHLNLGHTFGHALEAALGFTGVSHGEAVAWGIGKALEAGMELGITEPRYAAKVKSLLIDFGYRLEDIDYDREALLAAMAYDKKRQSRTLRFVLQRNFGDTRFSPIPEQVLRRVL